MQKWDLFAYLSAFVTIVLAIALTDIIQSTHRLLRARKRVKWDVLTPLVAFWVFLWILSEFFALWLDARFVRVNYLGLVTLMIVPTFTALAAYAALPDDVPAEGIDLKQFYVENLGYILALLTLINLGDVLRIVVYAIRFDGFNAFAPWIGYLVVWSGTFAVLGILYFVRTRWVQVLGVGLLFARIAVFAFLGDAEIRAN